MTTLVDYDPESRLAQLAAQYDLAKAEADKANEAFEAIKAAIKVELASAAPGESDVRFASPDLAAPLQLRAIESWRVDAKKLKAEQPETYVRYASKSTSWRLAPVSAS
jgi:hypothetical protein